MITLKEISLRNWISFGDDIQTVYFNKFNYPVLIMGINKLEKNQNVYGSNGSGKTALLSAIAFAFFNYSDRNNLDQLINKHFKKNLMIRIVFEINGQEKTIFKFRRHDIYKNNTFYFDGNIQYSDLDKALNVTNVKKSNDVLEDIKKDLGSYKTFFQTVFFSQKDIANFFDKNSNEKFEIFEGLIPELKIFKDFKEKVKEVIKDECENELEKLEKLYLQLTEIIREKKENIKAQLDYYNSSKEEKELQLEKAENNLKELKNINIENLENSLKILEEKQKRKIVIEQQIKTLKNLIIQDEDELKELKDLIEDSKNKLEKLNQVDIEKIKEETKIFENVLNELNKLENELKSTETTPELKLLANELKNNVMQQKRIDDEIQKNKKEIDKLIKEIEMIEKENICPTCKQPLKENNILIDYKNKLKEKETLLNDNENKSKELTNFIDKLNKDVEELSFNIEKRRNEIKEKINFYNEQLKDYKPEKHNQEFMQKIIFGKQNLKEKIDFHNKKIVQLNENTEKNKKDLIEKENELKQFDDNELNRINDLKKQINDIKIKLKESEIVIKNCENELNNLGKIKEIIKKLKEELEQKKEELNNIEENKKQLYTDLENYKWWKDNIDEIKKIFISNIINIFNQQVNILLQYLFNRSISLKLNEDLSYELLFEGMEIDIESLSGGEQRRVNLAVNFALFLTSKFINKKQFNFLVLDEILDINLDNFGVSGIIKIIENLIQQNPNFQILIISHKDVYKDIFQNHLYIEKNEKGFSKILEKKLDK